MVGLDVQSRSKNTIQSTVSRCVVEVKKVLAGSLIVPNVAKITAQGKSKLTLSDFGEPPFDLVLPIAMLKQHVPSHPVRTLGNVDTNTTTNPTVPSIPTDSCINEAQPHIPPPTEDDTVRVVEELEYDSLSEVDVLNIRATSPAPLNVEESSIRLDPAPQHPIKDVYSSVLGDIFHFMDRPKVPMNHELKKAYFHSLTEVFLSWDPLVLDKVNTVLRQMFRAQSENPLTDAEVEARVESKMYYDRDWFRKRVPRLSLSPSMLYPRV